MDKDNPFLFVDRYILYSAHKRWVMVVEHGAYCALWGGDEALADLLTLKCSQISRPIQEFLSFWKPDVPFMDAEFDLGASYAWIVRLLIHVYGHEKAMSLLCESGF